ncbi:MAG: hypothetical protein ABEI27_11370 [Halobellus sp.]|uniref:DUF7311 family protein n=1 Tax=Halobellus sp. TaxID=1979212 RepID=UPI0035D3E4BF
MIRLVVAAVLTVATLAAAVPAIADAGATRAAEGIESAADRIERAGHGLASTNDPVETRRQAATRRVTVTLPRASWTTAAPAFVAVGGRPGGPGNRSVVTYALPSSPTRLRGLSLPVQIRTPTGPVVFRSSGRHALSLALVADARGPSLVVSRGSRG